ncbi:NYN domain-containing protein [Microterricola pindariensis]|uniref:NYN domain-containing protein n=1 Tax=Microterricola pindariensis TaxID=478010 RepID=A0ABX5AXI4_9MICO|nr:NYN domain-containing protein [Microterricola pindariensis]PPL19597.1 NYN domain-containing protein [Microterricola pindariensis]
MTPAPNDLGQKPATRAALFVDFDNVYIGLLRLDAAAAERFATDPGRWTEAMADGAGESGLDGSTRRFLVRKCYLNPSAFSKYRAYWTRAGYRVIDCPSLTQQGKSSTDINLVLDTMDVLAGPGRIEEFFIASADADFTSLIQRIRAADRFTTVVVAGSVAGAYRSMADRVVESDAFVSILNGPSADSAVPAGSSDEEELPASEPLAVPSGSTDRPVVSTSEGRARAAEAVLGFVRKAPGPVAGGQLAKQATTAEPSILADWAGFNSFGAWVAQLGEGIAYSSRPAPGWAWDTTRFSGDDLPISIDERPAIEQQVARVTDVPSLSTAQYRQLFTSLESRIRDETFNRTETSKVVRDDCAAAGVPISRAAINYVIQGLLYSGVSLQGNPTATDLATGWAKNVEALCRGARMEFDDQERAAMRTWVSGGLAN